MAAMNAKFGLPEVGLGIIPGYGGTQRLAKLIGPGKAKKLIFSGEQVSAEEAYQIGLVEKLVPVGEAFQAAKVLARKTSYRHRLRNELTRRLTVRG
ncbi:enoyl-CoA hydratase-related protein [Metabacillus litoralis]|nr:enoyl-CoA hydratase-related protein [Metabacillus litoralis]